MFEDPLCKSCLKITYLPEEAIATERSAALIVVRAQIPKRTPRPKDEGCILVPRAGERGDFVTDSLIPAGWSTGAEKREFLSQGRKT